MIHLPTAAGGTVRYTGPAGRVALRGEVLARVVPPSEEGGPIEEIVAPFDAIVAVQRLADANAPRHAKIIGLRRVVVASIDGRVRWLASLGPVGVETLVALVANEGAGVVRPHRAGGIGFVGEQFARPGQRVEAGAPLLEIRGEEMA
jgi:hypothetical protein